MTGSSMSIFYAMPCWTSLFEPLLTMHVIIWALIAFQVGAAPGQPSDQPEAGRVDALPTGVIAQLGTNRFRSVGQMEGLRLSPDGRILATLGSARELRLWDVEAGRLLR